MLCTEHFTFIISFSPHKCPCKGDTNIIIILQMRKNKAQRDSESHPRYSGC